MHLGSEDPEKKRIKITQNDFPFIIAFLLVPVDGKVFSDAADSVEITRAKLDKVLDLKSVLISKSIHQYFVLVLNLQRGHDHRSSAIVPQALVELGGPGTDLVLVHHLDELYPLWQIDHLKQ